MVLVETQYRASETTLLIEQAISQLKQVKTESTPKRLETP